MLSFENSATMAVRALANFSFSSLIITSFSLFSTLSHLPSCRPFDGWRAALSQSGKSERDASRRPSCARLDLASRVPASRAQRSHVSAGPEVVAVASLHFDGSRTRPCGLGPGGSPGLNPAEPAHLARGGPDVKARPGARVPARDTGADVQPKTAEVRCNLVAFEVSETSFFADQRPVRGLKDSLSRSCRSLGWWAHGQPSGGPREPFRG